MNQSRENNINNTSGIPKTEKNNFAGNYQPKRDNNIATKNVYKVDNYKKSDEWFGNDIR